MASGRFLSISIAEDERLGKLSITAELIYIKTIPHLDRDGMISGKPGLLWAKACPLREELFGHTQAIVEEWVKLGLVIRFATDEGPVLFFTGFSKNNNLPHYDRERPSRFPPPPGYTRNGKGLVTVEQVQDELQEPLQEFDSQEQEEDQDKDKEEAATRAGTREATPPTAAAVDPNVAIVWETWLANMPGTLTPVIVDAVNGLLKKYSAAEIVEAITIAVKKNNRSLSYIEGILVRGAFSTAPPGNGFAGKDKIHEAAEASRKRLIADGKGHLL